MESDCILVTTSINGEAAAEALAASVVEARLAACVQIVAIRSVYRWKGEVCREPEWLLLIKTVSGLYEKLEAHIKAHHPYEVAEITQMSIAGGSAEYMAWIRECTA